MASWLVPFGVLLAPTLFAGYALKKRSVDRSGAIAGWIVGFGCVLAGWHFFWTLLWFFVSSTLLTKLGSKRKKQVEDGYKEGGQRNWVQVFCNGLSGTLACFILAYVQTFGAFEGWEDAPLKRLLTAAFLGHFGCCIGDTWASESGTAVAHSATRAFLITTFKPVPSGTNGGVSALGTAASVMGGLSLGLCFALTSPAAGHLSLPEALCIGALSGFGGSVVDSVLGATVQFSGYAEGKGRVVNEPGDGVQRISGRNLLDNHQVNLVASSITAVAAAAGTALL